MQRTALKVANPDSRPRPQGFTLVELLVVIGIIALLIAILIPAVGHVRTAGYEASTRAQIQTLSAAIEQYHNSFNAYPGPIANTDLIGGTSGLKVCTGTENLTLALMGGANFTKSTVTPQIPSPFKLGSSAPSLYFNPAEIGQGPLNMNPAKVQRYPALIEAKTGHLQDQPTITSSTTWSLHGAPLLQAYGETNWTDSGVPVFLDRFPDPLPILYIRANVGTTTPTGTNTTVQYNVNELVPYHFPEPYSGVGKARIDSAVGSNPTDTYLKSVQSGAPLTAQYFTNPNITTVATPYQKDGYILISAGRDRIYMSLDDLDSFGSPK